MKHRTQTHWPGAVVLAAISLCGFSGRAFAAWGKYTLGVTERMTNVSALVADYKGFWKADGLPVGTFMVADEADTFRAAARRFRRTGRKCVDFVVCPAANLARQRALGLDMVPIAHVANDAGHTKIVTRKGIASFKQLKGKKVACDLDTANLFLLSEALKKAGLSLDDVSIQDLHGLNNPRTFLLGEVDAIVLNAQGAAECVQKKGKVLATSKDFPGVMPEVLCGKRWVLEKQPDLAGKMIKSYAKAQAWARDPKNEKELARVVDSWFDFLKYQDDPKPLGADFVKRRIEGFELIDPAAPDAKLKAYLAKAEAFFFEQRRRFHDGEAGLSAKPVTRTKTRTAFDNAFAWWRFADEGDYRNYGSAGAELNLKARGDEKRLNKYGVMAWDFYTAFRKNRLSQFKGFQNDGYGWATDSVPKYPVTDNPIRLPADFTVWMRASLRPSRDMTLLEPAPDGAKIGFRVTYRRRGSDCSFALNLLPLAKEPALVLADSPMGTCVDACFVYDSKKRALSGRLYETQTGKLVTTARAVLAPGAMTPFDDPLALGGRHKNDTLWGNIENLAIWKRVLSEKEIRELTHGPKRARQAAAGGRVWHDVRDFGAKGDGDHDDGEAIQRAIDSCVFPTINQKPSWRRWHSDPQPRPGFGSGGVVFLPQGVYYTTRPIVVRAGVALLGEDGVKTIIDSAAEAAIVFWQGPWNDRRIDFKPRGYPISRRVDRVTLRNLWIRGKRFGIHTMGTSANRLVMENCYVEGRECGFVSTGFMMGSAIRHCAFGPSIWILAKNGTRYNTSTMEHILVGMHGSFRNVWRMRLEGCIQCVRISGICFERAQKGIYLKANMAGATIEISDIWNYDTGKRWGTPEVLRIVAGFGITIRNVMAGDHPSTIFIGKNVRHIKLENVFAKSITVEDAKATRPIFSNVPTKKYGDRESMIEEKGGLPKKLPK